MGRGLVVAGDDQDRSVGLRPERRHEQQGETGHDLGTHKAHVCVLSPESLTTHEWW